jgi:hypothetical protein
MTRLTLVEGAATLILYGTVSEEPPHVLQLRVGRRKIAAKALPPRPDDPLPRGALSLL